MAPLALPIGGTGAAIIFVLLVCPFVVASAVIMIAHASDRLGRLSPEAEMSQLADLYLHGALSDREFADAKQQLLSGHPAPTQPV